MNAMTEVFAVENKVFILFFTSEEAAKEWLRLHTKPTDGFTISRYPVFSMEHVNPKSTA